MYATPLHVALELGELQIASRLIEYGASLLDHAVRSGSIDTVAHLLHRARLNEPDAQTGATPIMEPPL